MIIWQWFWDFHAYWELYSQLKNEGEWAQPLFFQSVRGLEPTLPLHAPPHLYNIKVCLYIKWTPAHTVDLLSMHYCTTCLKEASLIFFLFQMLLMLQKKSQPRKCLTVILTTVAVKYTYSWVHPVILTQTTSVITLFSTHREIKPLEVQWELSHYPTAPLKFVWTFLPLTSVVKLEPVRVILNPHLYLEVQLLDILQVLLYM